MTDVDRSKLAACFAEAHFGDWKSEDPPATAPATADELRVAGLPAGVTLLTGRAYLLSFVHSRR